MSRSSFALFFLISFCTFRAQNDIDALRYSRTGNGGSARFAAMGGAFGALGAELSCASVNPAGLGLYRKGDLCFGFGIRFSHNKGQLYGNSTKIDDARLAYNFFGTAFTWSSKTDPESRHIMAFTVNQLENFGEKTRLSAYTNSNSIAKDMLNIAEQKRMDNDSLNFAYEGAGYTVYVLDYDSVSKKYFSFVDLKRSVKQTRDIVTAGRVNDVGFSYAYSWKDKLYFGASLGLPKVTYTSTVNHTEQDDKDSMTITLTSPTTYTTTYTEPLGGKPYSGLLGFNSLQYSEYFTTTGGGVNMKLGVVARVNDYLRFGAYIHSPTVYTLRDVYYNKMTATFDYDPKKVLDTKYPSEGGYFNYKIVTPSRYGISVGYVLKKAAAFGLDVELMNYGTARLSSAGISDFAGVNAVIANKYKYAANMRFGAEFNAKPVMLRAGYRMMGSPFGDVFNGKFVRHTISIGAGFRTSNNLYFDFVWYRQFGNEDYFMFNTIPQKAVISVNNSMFSVTAGLKF